MRTTESALDLSILKEVGKDKLTWRKCMYCRKGGRTDLLEMREKVEREEETDGNKGLIRAK